MNRRTATALGQGGTGGVRSALARLGIDGDHRELAALGLDPSVPDAQTASDAEAVVAALDHSADPRLALRGLALLAERNPDAWTRVREGRFESLRRVAAVAAVSEPLAVVAAGNDAALGELLGDLEPWTPTEVARRGTEAIADRTGDEAAVALAGVQRTGLVRIAARDVLGFADPRGALLRFDRPGDVGQTFDAVATELADLAQGVLCAALDHVGGRLRAEDADAEETDTRLAIIGMGKLGGRELNYVSDVDVLFVFSGDQGRATRWAERFLRLLGAVTPAGRIYEIDTNLRPEGRDGPLVRTLESCRSYYERWAKHWEFQALLKARPVAGDTGLGQAFVEAVAPRVWPDRMDAAAVKEIQDLKGVVERSREVQRAGSRQLKLAPGGLRDIEFSVQLLQLVHGRHDSALRACGTLPALASLAHGGYVGEEDAEEFADAYRFLRTLEHRVQLTRLRRTHTLPNAEADRTRLARALGYRDHSDATARERFDTDLVAVQGVVRRLHEKLFYRPLLGRFAEVDHEAVIPVLARGDGDGEGGLALQASKERLVALGFADAQTALRDLEALCEGLSRRALLFRMLLPALLPTLAATPDPIGGLTGLRSLADKLHDAPLFLRTLRDNPPVGELLMQVLGYSPVVGQWLQRQPDTFGQLADLHELDQNRQDTYRRLAVGLLRRGEDPQGISDGLRRLRRREAARIAVRDLTGRAGLSAVSEELSGLAEACLEAALRLVVPTDVRMAVIGLGKLGGRELSYASDLDILLVADPPSAHESAQRAAERFVKLLSGITPEGQAFRVDLRLRPEGKDGPLARSLDSYGTYYARWGEPWEYQALTQARPVAGDMDLAGAFMEAVAPAVYPRSLPADRVQTIRRIKARIERERSGGRSPRRNGPAAATRFRSQARGRERGSEWVDLKLGAGGLADLEWTVQLLQMQLGGRHPELRQPGALAALDALEDADAIEPRDALWLRQGARLLRTLRNALYLAGHQDVDRLPGSPALRERIAGGLHYATPGAQELSEDLTRAMRRVRKVHERLFYG